MKLETAKSFVLIILIGTSLILTFGMWNYQPDVGTLREESFEEVELGGTKEETRRSLIQPSEIIFKSNESFYGFSSTQNREEMYVDMQSWTFADFTTRVADERNPDNYEVEVIFPDAIPMGLFGSMMSFKDDDILFPEWSFERLYITFTDTASMGIEFVSTNGNEKATATVNNPNDYEQMWSLMTNLETDMFREYTVMDTGEKDIYIPSGEIELSKETMRFTGISPSDMRDILFPNPSVVMQSTTPQSGLTYFTDSRQMRISDNNLGMEYVNPFTENTDPPLTVDSLLERSIANINDHGGWTGDFQLTELNIYQNLVKYRLHYKGYPTFNNGYPDLSVIEQKWNSQQLEEYRRPLFLIDRSFQQSTFDLVPAENFIANLLNHPDYDRAMIEDIKLGYRLRLSIEKNAIELEPAWYINYKGNWQAPVFNETVQKGGD
ncbi:YycH family regulatory protein [Oceanobacillus longus]|uniref:YycH family regulatory protein n=1 Tax=Oceanobacillus longus TaxID=930120 RepID=A0ABV8GZV9_9BACI